MERAKLLRAALKTGGTLLLIWVGWRARGWWAEPGLVAGACAYWFGAGLLVLTWCAAPLLRRIAARRSFATRVQGLLTGLGHDRQVLYAAAWAVQRGAPEKALDLLDKLGPRAAPEAQATARWLRALAGVLWLTRQGRLLSPYREPFPQVHLLIFGPGATKLPLARNRLASELREISARQLDERAADYVAVVDRLIAALNDPRSAFQGEAQGWLEFLTGQAFVFRAGPRYARWWETRRPALCRGGGPFLAGLRLLTHACPEEAAGLLRRLEADGVLSPEAETVRGAAAFLALLMRPSWRLTADDVPRLFRDLHYCGWPEMGLLRLPLAARPEIASWCGRARELRAAKQEFIADVLRLWAQFAGELDEAAPVLLRRLAGHPGGFGFRLRRAYQRFWAAQRGAFEPTVVLLMDGIAAAAAGRHAEALRHFELAALFDPAEPAGFINQTFTQAALGRPGKARDCVQEALRRFPREPGVCLALGQLFALGLRDPEAAAGLFQRAHELDPAAAEPLLLSGELALAAGSYAHAQQCFDLAFRSDPSLLEAKLGLARVYLETQRFELAVEHLLHVSKEGQGEARHQAHYLLYRAHRELKADRRAIEYLDRLPPQFFREPDELDDIALHLESEQFYTKARVYAERAMLLRTQGNGPGGGRGDVQEV